MRIDRCLRALAAVAVLATAGLVGPAPLAAQQQDVQERLAELQAQVDSLRHLLAAQDTARIARLQRQIEALTRQIEQMRLGADVAVPAEEGLYGLAPAASKVYRVREGVAIGGYGELLYENFNAEREDGTPSGATDQLDALRAIVYVGYKFSDRFLFNSEIEFEHGSTGQAGSVSVEFAYLDYRLSDEFGVRAGMLLPPMGFINEVHEPPTFLGTERPETETRIIPSTWRENGIGVFGETRGLAYRAYLVNGFDAIGGGASNADGFSAAGLRGGRQKGSKALAEDFGGVARLDYVGQLGLIVGASAYIGESGQNRDSPLEPGETIGARTLIVDGHAQYRAHGLYLRGLAALADVEDVGEINAARGLSGSASVGERMWGAYLEAGYDVLQRTATDQQLIPYVRYERLNTQDDVPQGFAADPANDREIISIGAAWKPITNIIVKADYQIRSDDAETGLDQLNAAIGYLF